MGEERREREEAEGGGGGGGRGGRGGRNERIRKAVIYVQTQEHSETLTGRGQWMVLN